MPTTPTSAASSPSFRGYDSFSHGYGVSTSFPSSSVPSTPTSTRSRSPSISSLETIPDSPDAEEAAMEAERIAQLKAAAEAAENGDTGETKGRSSLDVPSRGRTLGFGSRDKRKRWSVCGAERRQDLDLETIWED
ncbi:basic proline-rich protein [Colletotrichum tofieldiae]|nr:basic proline-rich protein [Colletotrichum tofieldiae]